MPITQSRLTALLEAAEQALRAYHDLASAIDLEAKEAATPEAAAQSLVVLQTLAITLGPRAETQAVLAAERTWVRLSARQNARNAERARRKREEIGRQTGKEDGG